MFRPRRLLQVSYRHACELSAARLVSPVRARAPGMPTRGMLPMRLRARELTRLLCTHAAMMPCGTLLALLALSALSRAGATATIVPSFFVADWTDLPTVCLAGGLWSDCTDAATVIAGVASPIRAPLLSYEITFTNATAGSMRQLDASDSSVRSLGVFTWDDSTSVYAATGGDECQGNPEYLSSATLEVVCASVEVLTIGDIWATCMVYPLTLYTPTACTVETPVTPLAAWHNSLGSSLVDGVIDNFFKYEQTSYLPYSLAPGGSALKGDYDMFAAAGGGEAIYFNASLLPPLVIKYDAAVDASADSANQGHFNALNSGDAYPHMAMTWRTTTGPLTLCVASGYSTQAEEMSLFAGTYTTSNGRSGQYWGHTHLQNVSGGSPSSTNLWFTVLGAVSGSTLTAGSVVDNRNTVGQDGSDKSCMSVSGANIFLGHVMLARFNPKERVAQNDYTFPVQTSIPQAEAAAFLTEFARAMPLTVSAGSAAALRTWHAAIGSSYLAPITNFYKYNLGSDYSDYTMKYGSPENVFVYGNRIYLDVALLAPKATPVVYDTYAAPNAAGVGFYNGGVLLPAWPHLALTWHVSSGPLVLCTESYLGTYGGQTITLSDGTYTAAGGRSGRYWVSSSVSPLPTATGAASVVNVWFTILHSASGSTVTGAVTDRRNAKVRQYDYDASCMSVTGANFALGKVLLAVHEPRVHIALYDYDRGQDAAGIPAAQIEALLAAYVAAMPLPSLTPPPPPPPAPPSPSPPLPPLPVSERLDARVWRQHAMIAATDAGIWPCRCSLRLRLPTRRCHCRRRHHRCVRCAMRAFADQLTRVLLRRCCCSRRRRRILLLRAHRRRHHHLRPRRPRRPRRRRCRL
jgi:hypothetical protein